MIMSSSICRHFSTFPFVKLIEQFNELKSFRRREKNTHPTIITVIKSGNYRLALWAPVTGLQPPWAWELAARTQEGQTEPSGASSSMAVSSSGCYSCAEKSVQASPDPGRTGQAASPGVSTSLGSLASQEPCTWCGKRDHSLGGI